MFSFLEKYERVSRERGGGEESGTAEERGMEGMGEKKGGREDTGIARGEKWREWRRGEKGGGKKN